ncbi:MAG TPA: hypothetical protein VFW33_07930 [Gemmataceae bacterium]|nr:hypothetical protein [Gemmataceae bacterium]
MFAFFGLDPIHWIIIMGLAAGALVAVVMVRRGQGGKGKEE